MKTKILSMLLVIVMFTLSLTSCGGNTPSGTPDTTTASEEKADSKWEDVSFNGESIIISLSDYEPMVVVKAGATNSVKYMQGPDAYTTDSVQNAVYDRNHKVETALGLDVEYQTYTYDSNPDSTLTVIENYVLADLENSPDIISTMSYGMVRAGIKGMLYNALSTEYENHFDFSHNSWYSDFMYENTLDESEIYMLGGDYFIDMLRYSYTVLVNMDMYNEIFAGEGGSESLFDLVKAGEWTYDEMMRCADMAFIDAGVIGQYDDEDTFGIVYDISWAFRTLLATSGLDVFEKNEAEQIRYVEDITDMHNFVDKLVEMGNHDSWRKNGGNYKGYNAYDVFIAGKSLFTLDAPVLMMEGAYLQSMDDNVALIPYPKYNKEVKYGALISDNANVGGIAYNSDKFTACSAFLQMATEESNTGKGSLIHEYYDVSLKYKLSSTPEQVAMLELVRTGLCSPKSFLYDNYFAKSVGMNTCGVLMRNSFNAATNTFASDWEAQYGAVQGALESTLTTYGGN